MSVRPNDVDLLGEPRSCRRLPAVAWFAWLSVFAAGAAIAIAAKQLA